MKNFFNKMGSRSALFLCGLAGVLFLVNLAIRFSIVKSCNPDYGAVDMNVIYGIQRILADQALYQDPELPTYAIIQYMPLHYFLVAWFCKALTIDWLQVQEIYVLARSFSLTLNLCTAVVLFAILRLLRFSCVLSLVGSLPVLIILTWHYYLRNDSSHLFFFVSAVYFLLRYIGDQRLLNLVVAALLSACCVMSKQNGILIVGVAGFYLFFLEKKYFASFVYGVCFIVFGIGSLVLLEGYNFVDFIKNTYLGLRNGIAIWYFNSSYFFLVPAFVFWGIILFTGRSLGSGAVGRFLLTGGSFSFLFAAISCIKLGSDINYFVEFLIFVLITIPFCLHGPLSEKILIVTNRFRIKLLWLALFVYVFLIVYKTGTLVVRTIDRSESEFSFNSKSLGISAQVKVEAKTKSRVQEYNRSVRLLRYFKEEVSIKHGEFVFTYFLDIPERNFLDNIFIEYSLMPTKDVISQVSQADATTFDYSEIVSGMNCGLIKYIIASPGRDIFGPNDYLPFLTFEKTKFQWLLDVEGYAIYEYSGG